MKRLFPICTAVVLSVILSFGVLGCGGSSSSSSDGQTTAAPSDNTSAKETDLTKDIEPETADMFTAEYQDTIITYKNCEILTDDYGNSALYVYFDFTNNNEEKKAFYTTYSAKIYENGIELDDIVISMIDNKAHDNYSSEIKTGVTAEVAAIFAVPESFPVVLEVEPWISIRENVLLSFEIQPE